MRVTGFGVHVDIVFRLMGVGFRVKVWWSRVLLRFYSRLVAIQCDV